MAKIFLQTKYLFSRNHSLRRYQSMMSMTSISFRILKAISVYGWRVPTRNAVLRFISDIFYDYRRSDGTFFPFPCNHLLAVA